MSFCQTNFIYFRVYRNYFFVECFSLILYQESLYLIVLNLHSTIFWYSTHINQLEYIGEFEIVDDHRGGKIVVDLIGRINKCGVISPRFDVKTKEFEQWATNVLPSRQVCIMVFQNSD